MKKTIFSVCVTLIFSITFSFPQSVGRGEIDEESTRLIREYTTEDRFLTLLVDHIPESPTIPSPREVLSYVVGTPKKLTYYDDIIHYMKILADSSEKVELIPMGKTTLDRMMYIIVISSEDTIRNLDMYKEYSKALSDPRKTPEAKAQALIQKAKPIYYVSCNLHSSETGSAEMSMELAYRLVASKEQYIKSILDNLIVLITPSLEPDGHDVFTDFYYRYRKDICDERSDFPHPPYWGKYAHHNNNRDIGANLPLTKNVINMLLEWHPQVHLDLHESFAYLFIFPGSGPFYPEIDPIHLNEWQWLTYYEITELTKMGLQGVWSHGFHCGWYAGSISIGISNLHNINCRFYETFGNNGATTMERNIAAGVGLLGEIDWTKREWYRPWPPDDKVIWSLRNNINYQQSGVLCSLENVALHRGTILYNFWKKGYNAINRGRHEPPYAWVIPPSQRHPVEMANLLNLLIRQGVEIHTLRKDIKVREGSFPRGSYLVRMDQPLRPYAKTMLEVQKFPESYPYPFDDTGWTLGYMHGVETVRIDDSSILDTPGSQVKEKVQIKGKIAGNTDQASYVIIPHRANNNLITARFILKDREIYASEESFTINDTDFPRGSFIIPIKTDKKKEYDEISAMIEEMGLDACAFDGELSVQKHLLNLPRIALYHTWTYTRDSGWARFAFDQYKIPYETISKDRVKEGNLKRDFEVIIIPRQCSASSIISGINPKKGPIAYDRTDEFRYMGVVDQSKDITGGMGLEGLSKTKDFVEAGGVLVLIGPSSMLALDNGLVRNIHRASTQKLVVPGSIVKGEVANEKSPLLYGYEKHVPILCHHSFGSGGGFGFQFDIPEEEKQHIVLRYAEDDSICLSGIVVGENELKGNAAIVAVPVKKGYIIMFNFNPLHRFQNKVDFMLVFNILLNFDDL